MKLAEALIERADLQRSLEVMRMRLRNNAKVQEGTLPNEEISTLLTEMQEMLSRLEYLIIHINRTNEYAKMSDGKTIAEAIAKKDILSKELSILSELLSSGSEVVNRYTKSEIRLNTTFSVKELQANLSERSKELRILDTRLQEANWLTELI